MPEKALSVFRIAQDLKPRTEILDGVEHTVLPMVAMVEGVYQCANCPTAALYTAREFGKHPAAWNGRPVTFGHPMRDGNFVSAGHPSVWDGERIGTTFNARVEGDKLHVEAWLSPSMLERTGATDTIAAAVNGDQIDVSIGTWVDEMPQVGVHSGRKYDVVNANFQPDHIAILDIGTAGACNWEDGCGVRAAAGEAAVLRVSSAADAVAPCCDDCAKGSTCQCHPVDANQTAKSRERAMEIALEGLYTSPWVVDFDDEYVYFVADGVTGLRRRGYTEDDEGTITLAGDTDERVRPRTDYVAASGAGDFVVKDCTFHMERQSSEGVTAPAAMVDGQGADKENGIMADKQKDATPAKAPDDATAGIAAEVAALNKRLAEMEAERDQLKERLSAPKPATVEEYISAAPAELRDSLFRLHKQEARRKLDLVQVILQAPKCPFEEDELKKMDMAALERLATLAGASLTQGRVDYGVRAPAQSFVVDSDSYAEVPPSPWDQPTGQTH